MPARVQLNLCLQLPTAGSGMRMHSPEAHDERMEVCFGAVKPADEV